MENIGKDAKEDKIGAGFKPQSRHATPWLALGISPSLFFIYRVRAQLVAAYVYFSALNFSSV